MAQAHVILPVKRDSVQTFDTTDKSLPVKAVTKGHWIETHDKASGIYVRQDMLEGSKDVAANGIVESQATANYDAIIHKPASGIWRRRGTLPVGAIAHERAHDISDGGEKPQNEKKRDANPVSSPEVQSQANSLNDVFIHNPASGVWRKRGILPIISLPSGPIVHPKAADVSDGGDEPHSERKREVPLSEEATSISGPHLFPRQSFAQDSTPSAVSETTSETTAPEAPAGTTQEDAEQPAPDSIQAAAQRFKDNYPYTQPHWTPAIVHEADNDIHRREERVRAREWVG